MALRELGGIDSCPLPLTFCARSVRRQTRSHCSLTHQCQNELSVIPTPPFKAPSDSLGVSEGFKDLTVSTIRMASGEASWHHIMLKVFPQVPSGEPLRPLASPNISNK